MNALAFSRLQFGDTAASPPFGVALGSHCVCLEWHWPFGRVYT